MKVTPNDILDELNKNYYEKKKLLYKQALKKLRSESKVAFLENATTRPLSVSNITGIGTYSYCIIGWKLSQDPFNKCVCSVTLS